MKNKVQLITYPDSLGGDLRKLKMVLDSRLQGKIGAVHILPFYPSSSDRGFSPLTQMEVDPKFGNWEDIGAISQKYEVVADFVVNHISSQSKIFQNYLRHGNRSRYRGYFISPEKFSSRIDERKFKGLKRKILAIAGVLMNKFRKADIVFHKMGVNRLVLKKIYRPRTGSPFEKFLFADGKSRSVWCTFSRDQIDLDLENKSVKNMLRRSMVNLAEKGIKLLRLDAVGYCVKKRGSTNFMIPQTFKLISGLAKDAHDLGMEVLPEVHNNYSVQLDLARRRGVDFVYDFSLPLLVLYSLFKKDSQQLKHWIEIRPDNQITTLDTHDGIGIIDVEGLLPKKEAQKLAEYIFANGGNATLRASGSNSHNVDLYQINITYFSALGEDEKAYLIARAIQFFVPGIPQVYYVGWLAGKNDEKKVDETGIGRDINRHDYTLEEIKCETTRPVVRRLEDLMEFRSNYSAFDGKFKMLDSSPNELKLSWQKGRCSCVLNVDLSRKDAHIECQEGARGSIRKWDFCQV